MSSGTPFPNLFIVGAAKAGTTSLYKYLADCRFIYMSHVKEPHFFASFSAPPNRTGQIKDLDEYLRLFVGATTERFIGEASPSYLWDETTPMRIRGAAPNAKIIIILREPAARAYSHYLMDIREGDQTLPFYDALLEDYHDLRKAWGVSHLYLELGLYCEQVKRYLDTFSSQNVLVLFYEEFFTNLWAGLGIVYKFLGIRERCTDDLLQLEKHNSFATYRNKVTLLIFSNKTLRRVATKIFSQQFRKLLKNRVFFKRAEKPEMDQRARDFLEKFYRAENIRLEHILSRELPWHTSSGLTHK